MTALLSLAIVVTAHAQRSTVRAQVEVHHVRGSDGADNSNVVVWLMPLAGTPDMTEKKSKHYTITQKNKQFIPHVLAVPVGTKIEFPNKDPFFHNVFSLFQGKRFDLGLYEAGSSREVLFDRPGTSFIFCNIHPDMSAYVLALSTPYFDTSGKEGHVTITGVSPGRYKLQVWYERAESSELNSLSRTVEVSGSDVNVGTIQITESSRFQSEHSNKHGKAYDPEQNPY
jgi:plastocyanin